MSTGVNKNKKQLLIILLPYQQPVRLQVAFPTSLIIAMQAMLFIFIRQASGFGKNRNRLNENVFIKSPFHTFFERPFERPCCLNLVPHDYECK